MTSLSLNVGNFITLKLTPTNYTLWREQALALAESQDLVGHLTNEDPAPTQYTTPNSNNITNSETFTPKLTTEFVTWRKADRLLRGWIIGTLFEEALGLVVGLDTSHAVWDALKDAYAEDSQECEFTLRQQIIYLRKEDDRTIGEHIRVFKGLCDNLAAIGKPIPDKEKSLDQRRSWFSSHTNMQNPLTPHMAFYGQNQQRSHQSSSRHRTDSVLIGDGSSLPILGTGDSFIKQRNVTLPLHDVLLEREIGKPIITARRKGDLYELSPSPDLHYSHRFKSGSADTWHQRLGHPQTTALQLLKNKGTVHQVSCPYTSEQTSIVERRHRIIRELDLPASSSTSPCLSLLPTTFYSPTVHLPVTTPLPSTTPLTSSSDQLGTTHESVTQPEQSSQPEVEHHEYSAQPS
ncbi:gag-polypeptide of LTR copia-type [Sesbania bispinosa]|nr:gag-polypeptide of LTR copia-type [Sesbania bispinosa]